MKALFKIRDYRLLWTGQAVSNFGDALTNLALLLTAQRLTGSTAAVATTAIAVALPTLLFGMVAGAYVDRWNRKRVMIVSDLFRTSFVLLFLLVSTPDMMWLLYSVAFIQAALGTFFSPAKSAFVPRIVPREQLLSANSVSQMTQIVFGLIGTAIAGLIAATMETLALAYILDASTFIISLIAISLIRTDGAPQRTDMAETHILRDIKQGIQTALGSRVLVGVLVGASILMLGIGAVNVLLVPFIIEDLAVSEAWFAAFEAAQVVPMVIAASLIAAMAARVKPTRLITISLGGLGILLATMALATAPLHMVIILFCVGWMVTPLQASVSTLVQTEVDDEIRGRTGAALNTVLTGSQVASMALAGVAATALGTRAVFVIAGAIAVIASASTLALFKGVTLRAPAPSPEPAPEAA
jgi:MFS family permease